MMIALKVGMTVDDDDGDDIENGDDDDSGDDDDDDAERSHFAIQLTLP